MSLDPFSFLALRVAMGTKAAHSNFLPYGATTKRSTGEEGDSSSHRLGELHVLDPSVIHSGGEAAPGSKDSTCVPGKLSGVVATLQ